MSVLRNWTKRQLRRRLHNCMTDDNFSIPLQVGVTYNVDKAPDENSFDFLLEVIRETDYEIEVQACSKWTENDQSSGMAVMDVGIPSGFELDQNSVDEVRPSIMSLTRCYFSLSK